MCSLSESEVMYLLDLFKEIKSDTPNIHQMIEEIEQAEELLNGAVEVARKEQEQSENNNEQT